MKLKQLLLTILLTTIILAACNNQAEISEESQEPTTNFVLYTDEELGVALNHPEDWVVHSGFGGLTVASSQESSMANPWPKLVTMGLYLSSPANWVFLTCSWANNLRKMTPCKS
jgi:uncharacterized lipoprotein NlpE involved in copper resistance